MPLEGSHTVFMRLYKYLTGISAPIDRPYMKYVNDKGTFIVKFKKALYGSVKFAKLWYYKISHDLSVLGYTANAYNMCTRTVNWARLPLKNEIKENRYKCRITVKCVFKINSNKIQISCCSADRCKLLSLVVAKLELHSVAGCHHFIGVADIADISLLLRAYSALQRNRYEDDISEMITTSGQITISLSKLMSFGGVLSDELLIEYSIFLKNSPLARGLRNLIDLTWDRHSSHAGKKITFNITASPESIRRLMPISLLTTSCAHIDEVQTPSLKRPRISKIESYSPPTLAKYSKLMETKLMTLLNEEIPSANEHLRHEVLRDVILRVEKTVDGVDPETCNINNAIVANLENLHFSLEKYGLNNREQIKFKENIAIAISGTVSMMRLKSATGLLSRRIDHGMSMRILFDIETAKAVAEEQAKIKNVTLIQSNETICTNEIESEEADK